jgi:hypothetical protein
MTATALCVRVVDPALDWSLPMWGDSTDGWQPAALEWLGTLAAAGVPLRAGPDASIDDGQGLLIVVDPDAVAFETVRGRPVLTGPPPETPAKRLAAVRDALGALAVPDMRAVMVLRLDDPGAAVKHHLEGWAHAEVDVEAWDRMWDALGDRGRMSVFCSPGWVNEDGTVIASRRASPEEWVHLDRGAARGRVDLECHGFTHMDPDLAAWLGASDRHSNPAWYREMWPPRLAEEPSIGTQQAILRRWQDICGPGTAFVAPGEAWGVNTVTAARLQGFGLFNSWGLCRLDLPVPTWSVGVGSPYLDQADATWLEGELPVVGYWHDRDMAVSGPAWVPAQLRAWQDCGIRRFVAFSDLAAAYATEVDAAVVDGEVVVRRAPEHWPLRIETGHQPA